MPGSSASTTGRRWLPVRWRALRRARTAHRPRASRPGSPRPHVLVGRADGQIGLRGLAEVDRGQRRPKWSPSSARRRGSSRSDAGCPSPTTRRGFRTTPPPRRRRPAGRRPRREFPRRGPGAPRPKSFALSTAPRWSPVSAVSAIPDELCDHSWVPADDTPRSSCRHPDEVSAIVRRVAGGVCLVQRVEEVVVTGRAERERLDLDLAGAVPSGGLSQPPQAAAAAGLAGALVVDVIDLRGPFGSAGRPTRSGWAGRPGMRRSRRRASRRCWPRRRSATSLARDFAPRSPSAPRSSAGRPAIRCLSRWPRIAGRPALDRRSSRTTSARSPESAKSLDLDGANSDGMRVVAIYAYPAGQPDRFASAAR